MSDAVCAIWGTPATRISGYEGRDGEAVDSPRAGGRYFITGTAKAMVQSLNERQKVALTHEIVNNAMLGSTVSISSSTLETLQENPRFSPALRSSRLLSYLIMRSEFLGHPIEFPGVPYDNTHSNIYIFGMRNGPSIAPLFAWSDSTREEEVIFLLEMLADRKFIKPLQSSNINEIIVLPAGYTESSLENSKNNREQAFVAMWFDSTMHDPYETGVEAAVRECGFRPLRIDRKEHNNRIDDEILAEIKKSRFVIADFTSEPDKPRGGVYFEAGFALGLGIPVIWTCRADILSSIHFDTRQFNHIVWSEPSELRIGLINRIQATIGRGPLASLS